MIRSIDTRSVHWNDRNETLGNEGVTCGAAGLCLEAAQERAHAKDEFFNETACTKGKAS